MTPLLHIDPFTRRPSPTLPIYLFTALSAPACCEVIDLDSGEFVPARGPAHHSPEFLVTRDGQPYIDLAPADWRRIDAHVAARALKGGTQ